MRLQAQLRVEQKHKAFILFDKLEMLHQPSPRVIITLVIITAAVKQLIRKTKQFICAIMKLLKRESCLMTFETKLLKSV